MAISFIGYFIKEAMVEGPTMGSMVKGQNNMVLGQLRVYTTLWFWTLFQLDSKKLVKVLVVLVVKILWFSRF